MEVLHMYAANAEGLFWIAPVQDKNQKVPSRNK